jgi:hypothetical protein
VRPVFPELMAVRYPGWTSSVERYVLAFVRCGDLAGDPAGDLASNPEFEVWGSYHIWISWESVCAYSVELILHI